MSESIDLYRKVFESAPDGVLVVDAAGVVVDANPAVESLFGYTPAELVGKSIEILVPEADRSLHVTHRTRYMGTPHPRPMGPGLQLTARCRDGREIPVEISLSPFEMKGETCVVAMVRDVTERERLRAFGSGALKASEEERQRISRELHDDTAQQLAALMLRLRVLERAGQKSEWQAGIETIRDGLAGCADGVRRIARGLKPPELESMGLVEAIRSHVRAVEEDSNVTLVVDAEPVDALLSQDAKLVLYRIMQEAISNALRHAGASRVRVRLFKHGSRIQAEIQDDGVGLRLESLDRRGNRGLGLIGMQERAAILGGLVDIVGRPGEGTRVTVVIPSELAREAARV